MDMCMNPSLTIGCAHKIAGLCCQFEALFLSAVLARRHFMERIEGPR